MSQRPSPAPALERRRTVSKMELIASVEARRWKSGKNFATYLGPKTEKYGFRVGVR